MTYKFSLRSCNVVSFSIRNKVFGYLIYQNQQRFKNRFRWKIKQYFNYLHKG